MKHKNEDFIDEKFGVMELASKASNKKYLLLQKATWSHPNQKLEITNCFHNGYA